MAFIGCFAGTGINEVYASEVWIEISDKAGLLAIQGNLSANYRLTADIDLGGANWTTIGPFTGKLDGGSRVVRNLTINDTSTVNKGLFSSISASGQVSNLGIEAANVTAGDYAGILAGTNGGTISRCHVSGSITGKEYVGGLVGQNSGTVQNSYTRAAISGKDYVGGLAGSNSGTVQSSYASSPLSPSVFNNYVEFNGTPVGNYSAPNSGGYIDIPHKAAYVGNNFTLEAWFQWDDIGTKDVNFIIGKGYEQFEIHTGGDGAGINGIRFIPIANMGGDSWLDVKNVLKPGWFHVAASYEYNDAEQKAYARVYINGEAQDIWRGAANLGKTATLSRTFNTLGYGVINTSLPATYENLQREENNINIGRRTDGWYYFDGKICDVRFWNIVRNEEDIKRDKDKVLTGTEPGLVGYWKLNEASGDALDSTENNSNGTLTGAVVRTSEAAAIHKGGLIGYSTVPVLDSFYDSQVSGQSDTGKGEPKTTAEMKQQATFGTWDFTGVWGLDSGTNNGYPYLLSTAKAITAFTFKGLSPEVTGTISENSKTITLTVPPGTVVTSLVPTIVHTGVSMSPESGVAQNFTSPVTYTVTAEDGSTGQYTVTVNSEFAGGDGSVGNPYQITKLDHLNNMRKHIDKHFILLNDLDFADNAHYLDPGNKASWTTGQGWAPIAVLGYPFTGSFDGNSHVIKGLYINRLDLQSAGLFTSSKGLIKTLGLVDVNINASGYVGAFVGWSLPGFQIDRCYANGRIQGDFAVGGLIGRNDGIISNSYSVASVKGTSNSVGGIAGRIGGTAVGGNGTITNCFAAGKVYGTSDNISGIVGYNYGGSTFANSYYNAKAIGFIGGPGTGITTIQMKKQASFTGLDFAGIWNIQDSITFPYLRWQTSHTDQAWPAFKDGFSSVENVGGDSMDMHVENDETGTVYYVVLPAANSAPSEIEIRNGTGTGVITHGSFAAAANSETVETIDNLPPNPSSYKIYIVTEDSTGSLQIAPESLTVQLAAVTPAINTQPANIAKDVGQTTTFTVGAAAGDGGTLSYQWQKSADGGSSWDNIDGAGNASYITGVLAYSDTGSRYRCIITNSRNSTVSTSAAATSTALTTATAISNAAVLTITPAVAPTINTQPVSITERVTGQTAVFAVGAAAGDGGALSYQWQKSADGGSSWNNIDGAVNTSYTTGVLALGDNGSRYRCAVTNSKNSTTAISESNEAALTVLPAPVAPVIAKQPASITRAEGQTATFTIEAAADGAALTYQWQLYDSRRSRWNIISGATGTGYTTAPLSIASNNGARYRCAVTNRRISPTNPATTLASISTTSGEATLKVTPVAPGVPAIQSVTPGNGTVNLTWSPVSGAIYYKVYQAASPGAYSAPIATVTGTVYEASGLTNGTTYYFAVNATNAGGDSVYSDEVSATPATVPGVPAGVTAVAGDTQATVSFTAPSDNGGNSISLYTVTSNPGGITANGISSPITVTGLTNGTAYSFTVTAANDVGSGTESGGSNRVIPQVHVPAAVTGLVASGGSGQVSLGWSSASGAVYYSVYQGTSSGIYSTTALGTVTDNVYTATGLNYGTVYYYMVKAGNAGGFGPNSIEATAVTIPPDPAGFAAYAGDGSADLVWESAAGADGYRVYRREEGGIYDPVPLKTVTANSCTITGLSNGIKYYFIIKAYNTSGDSGRSNEVYTVPQASVIAPSAPTELAAAAGNAQVTLSWNAVTGASLYKIYMGTSAGIYGPTHIAAVTDAVYTATGLINGTTYYFAVKAYNTAGSSPYSNEARATPSAPSNPGGSGSSAPSIPSNTSGNTGVEIQVNGKSEKAGTVTTSTKPDGKTVTTVTVDSAKVEQKLAQEGNKAVVTIPVNTKSDIVIGELNGQMVKSMENKEAIVEVKTADVVYTLPAAQINIDNVSQQIGHQVALQDIKVSITVASPSADTVKVVQDTANKNNYQVVVKPVEFSITCTSGDKTVEVSRFNGYVERTVAIPDGIDPGKITTGVVLNTDGTFSHVPTTIVKIDGKYYAKISSLTNSIYSVIWNPKEFSDVADHWSRQDVNDMASRLVLSGYDENTFAPDRYITRGEFAAIVVRGLGLRNPEGDISFTDVMSGAWYYDFVRMAVQYGLISGYNDGTFQPDKLISREEAFVIISRAMNIAKFTDEMTDEDEGYQLSGFIDSNSISLWAKRSTALCIKKGIITGSNGKVNARENITRAETAAIIKRLLQKANLI